LYFYCLYAGCKDIDDALHCHALPNGNFEVGVRILCLRTYILLTMLVLIGLHVFKLEFVLLQLDGCDGLLIYLHTMGSLVLHVGVLISLYAYYFTSSTILSKFANALF